MIKFDLRNKKFKKFSAFFLALGLSAGSCFLSNSKIHAAGEVAATITNNYDGSVTLNFTKEFVDQGKFMTALKLDKDGNTLTDEALTKRLTDFFTQNFKVFVDPAKPGELTYGSEVTPLGFTVMPSQDDAEGTETFSSHPLSALTVEELTDGRSGISVKMIVRDGVNIKVTDGDKLSYNFATKAFYIAENNWAPSYYTNADSTKAKAFEPTAQ